MWAFVVQKSQPNIISISMQWKLIKTKRNSAFKSKTMNLLILQCILLFCWFLLFIWTAETKGFHIFLMYWIQISNHCRFQKSGNNQIIKKKDFCQWNHDFAILTKKMVIFSCWIWYLKQNGSPQFWCVELKLF